MCVAKTHKLDFLLSAPPVGTCSKQLCHQLGCVLQMLTTLMTRFLYSSVYYYYYILVYPLLSLLEAIVLGFQRINVTLP